MSRKAPIPNEIGDGMLLELMGDVCGLLDIDELRAGLLDGLHRVLPSDYISLNDVGPRPEDIVAIIQPDAPAATHEIWQRHAHENPILRYYLRTLDGRAYRFSDVISRAELQQLPLYRELYGPMGVEHQLAFTLPASPDRVLAIALSRGERDYSDAERDFANRARPFLIQAYLNAIAYEALRSRLPQQIATTLTETLLEAGLTGREAEVLALVALGRSNHHAGAELGISDRTVGKHLERGFRKLGVGDRSTAAGRVWELAGVDGNGSGAAGEARERLIGSHDGLAAAEAFEHAGLARQQAEGEGDAGED
jgi:DNA-binding CsgD family transcriptional regulator